MGTYRAKPATAAWIQRERNRLGLKATDLVERLALVGVEVSEQTIRVWESNADRRPSPANLDALERIFGSQAPERPAEQDTGALIAALTEHTAALRQQSDVISALVRVLLAQHGTPDPTRLAEIEAQVDRTLSRLHTPGPVATGTP